MRTLVLAKRNIKLTEYTQWAKKYTEVSSTLKNREEKMEEMQELIELDLELLAATAIEDKLQDQVGNTIESLKNAGIKFWVLTGDKIETAINIGYSCKLLDDKLEIIIVDGKESFEVESILDEKLKYLESKKRVRGMALVISGDALTHANVGEMSKKVNLATRFQVII